MTINPNRTFKVDAGFYRLMQLEFWSLHLQKISKTQSMDFSILLDYLFTNVNKCQIYYTRK